MNDELLAERRNTHHEVARSDGNSKLNRKLGENTTQLYDPSTDATGRQNIAGGELDEAERLGRKMKAVVARDSNG